MEKFIKLIKKYPNKKWDWYEISHNPNIKMEDIENNPDKPWNWDGISKNQNITMEIIEDNLDKPWNWGKFGISSNPNLTIEMIDKYPDKPWHWGENGISSNPIIPSMKKAAIKFGTTPIRDNLIFLKSIRNIANIPIITKPKVSICDLKRL